jgi:MFS family permease
MPRKSNTSIGAALFRARRLSDSENRRGMRTSLREGIPANIIANVLGGPLQTAFLLYLGFNSEQIGLIAAIPSLSLIIQIFIAFGMQRWSNRRLLVSLFGIAHRTLWVSTGLIPLLFPEASWFWIYVVLYMLSFFCAQSAGVIWTSLMADIVPYAVRGRYFGIRNTIHWAVASLTLLLGGQWMERVTGGEGFAYLFIVSAVCVVWNGWELAHYPNPPFERSESGSSAALLLKPLRDGAFLPSTLFITLFLLVQNVVVPLFSYAMLNILHLSYSAVTLITMFQNVVMMFSYIYWGNLNAKFPARTLLLWTFPLIAASCVVWLGMAALPALAVLVAAHLLLGFGLGGYNLLVFNFLIGDTPKSERPIYVAVFSALTGFAGFIGPIIGGWLFKLAVEGPAWVSRYGVVLVCGLVMLLLSAVVAPPLFRATSGPRSNERR